MRALALVAVVLVLVPLAAAHDENVLFRLRIDAPGGAGVVQFELAQDHRFLGVGVGGCSLTSVGALRILAPGGGVVEATMRGPNGCGGTYSNAAGSSLLLPAGTYAGAYAFEGSGPLLIELYGSDLG